MERGNTAILWSLVLLGIMGILIDVEADFPSFYQMYKTAIEVYLFVFSAFLVVKRVFFYRLKENVEVVRLKSRSAKQNPLLWQGAIIALLYVAYLWHHDSLFGPNAVMIALLLLYYMGQVLTNGNPSIYVDAHAFSFDDYFVENWPWRDLKKITVEEEKLTLENASKKFELDFDAIDGMDYVRLSQEVDASILDGAFVEDDSSKLLLDVIESHARNYNVSLQMY